MAEEQKSNLQTFTDNGQFLATDTSPFLINEPLLKTRYQMIKSRYRGNVQPYDDWKKSEMESNLKDYIYKQDSVNISNGSDSKLIGKNINTSLSSESLVTQELSNVDHYYDKKPLVENGVKNIIPSISEKIHNLVDSEHNNTINVIVDGIDGIYNKPSVLTVNVGEKFWRYNLIDNIAHSTENSYQKTIRRDKILSDLTRNASSLAPNASVKYSLRVENPNYKKELKGDPDNKKYIRDILTSNAPYNNVIWKLKRHVLPQDYVISSKFDESKHLHFHNTWNRPLKLLKKVHQNTNDNSKMTEESLLVGLKYHADKNKWLSDWKKNVLSTFHTHLKNISSNEQLNSTLDSFVKIPQQPQYCTEIENTTSNLAKIFDSRHSNDIHAKIGNSIRKCNSHYQLLNDINVLFGDKYQGHSYAMIGNIFDTLKRKITKGIRNITDSFSDGVAIQRAILERKKKITKMIQDYKGESDIKKRISLETKIEIEFTSAQKDIRQFYVVYPKIKDDVIPSSSKKSSDSSKKSDDSLKKSGDSGPDSSANCTGPSPKENLKCKVFALALEIDKLQTEFDEEKSKKDIASTNSKISEKINRQLKQKLNKQSVYTNVYKITPGLLMETENRQMKKQEQLIGFKIPELVNINRSQPLVSSSRGLYHSDSHIGNKMMTNNGFYLPKLIDLNDAFSNDPQIASMNPSRTKQQISSKLNLIMPELVSIDEYYSNKPNAINNKQYKPEIQKSNSNNNNNLFVANNVKQSYNTKIGDQFHLHNINNENINVDDVEQSKYHGNDNTDIGTKFGGGNDINNNNITHDEFEMAPLVDISTLANSDNINVGDKYTSDQLLKPNNDNYNHYSTFVSLNNNNANNTFREKQNISEPEELIPINNKSIEPTFSFGAISNNMNSLQKIGNDQFGSGFFIKSQENNNKVNISCHVGYDKSKRNVSDSDKKPTDDEPIVEEISNKIGNIIHINTNQEMNHFIDKHNSKEFYNFITSNESGQKYHSDNNIVVIPNDSKFKKPTYGFQQEKTLAKHFENIKNENMGKFVQTLEPFKTEKGAFISSKFVKTFDDTLYNVANTIYNPKTQKLYLFVE